MRFLLLLMLLIQIPVVHAAPPSAAPSPVASVAATQSASDPVKDQLKAAVLDSEKSLGTLTAQQKRIFDEEVVPDFPLFIRDFTRDGQTIHAQVDVDGIRSMTRFIAPVGSKILLYLNVDSQCAKCASEAAPIRQMMVDRVERRGFAPIWISADELAGTTIADLVAPRGAMGFLEVDLQPIPVSQDDEHEVKYVTRTQVNVRGIAHFQDQAEIYETGSFEIQTDKILTHAFTDLGSKADLAGISYLAKDDLLIQVNRISDFDQYQQLRDALQTAMKGVALIEQRELSRGSATFALKTHKTRNEIQSLLAGITLDNNKKPVFVGSTTPNAGSIVMEIR